MYAQLPCQSQTKMAHKLAWLEENHRCGPAGVCQGGKKQGTSIYCAQSVLNGTSRQYHYKPHDCSDYALCFECINGPEFAVFVLAV